LDGLGNGIPGSDYVKVFGPSILAGSNPPSTSTAQARFIAREVAAVRARDAAASYTNNAATSRAHAKSRPAIVDAAFPLVNVHKTAMDSRRRNRT
jgi:hypothetical protein